MSPKAPVTAESANVTPPPLDAKAVLAAAVQKEKARAGADIDVIEALESTILRVDAAEGAWEQALAKLRAIASSRVDKQLGAP